MNDKTKPPPGYLISARDWHDPTRRHAYFAEVDTREGTLEEVVADCWEHYNNIRAEVIADVLLVLDDDGARYTEGLYAWSEYCAATLEVARERIAALAPTKPPMRKQMTENNNNERFFYLRKFNKQPIGVMFLRKENDTQVRVAASLCAPTDRWNRDLGILRAKSRLDSKKQSLLVELGGDLAFFVVGDATLSINDIFNRLMPPKTRYDASPCQNYGVEPGYTAMKLRYQMERMLGVKK